MISDRDRELLSLLLDGELSPNKAAMLEARLAADDGLRAEFDVLHSVRVGVRNWFQEEQRRFEVECEKKAVNIWASISAEVERITEQQAAKQWGSGRSWSGFVDSLRAIFVPQPFLAGALAMLLVVGLYIGVNQRSARQLEVASENGAEEDGTAFDGSARFVIYRPNAKAPLSISEAAALDYLAHISPQGVIEGVPVAIPVRQVMGQDFVLGGLRTDGLDIEGIESSRGVHLFASQGRNEAPVIWVAQRNQPLGNQPLGNRTQAGDLERELR